MKAKLIVVGGDAKSAEIKLKLPTVIGRGREANLTLPHPLVSRKHCELFENCGKLWVRDLGSLNGTYVNNERIADSTLLPSGDLLTVGAVTFRAVYADQDGMNPPVVPGEATVRNASNGTTIQTSSSVAASGPNQSTEIEPAMFTAVQSEGLGQVDEVDEGLEVDELDAAEIEELAGAEIEDIGDTGPAPASRATLPSPAALNPPAQAGPKPAEGSDSARPTAQPAKLPETIDVPPPASPTGGTPDAAAGGSNPDDDALNDFLKGLR